MRIHYQQVAEVELHVKRLRKYCNAQGRAGEKRVGRGHGRRWMLNMSCLAVQGNLYGSVEKKLLILMRVKPNSV